MKRYKIRECFPAGRNRHVNPLLLWVVLFFLLMTVNIVHLWDPPYWDGITGVYSQGIWLKNNQFDFFKLFEQNAYADAGPKVNLYLAMAPLFGVLSLVLPPVGVFFCLHLLTVVCASVTAAIFFVILRNSLSLWPALLWVLAALFNPIWNAQTAGMYLEIPAAALASLSLLFFWKKRFLYAGTLCFLGFFMKDSVLLLALTYFVFALADMVFSRFLPGRGVKMSRVHLCACMAPAPVMVLLNQVNPQYFKINWGISHVVSMTQYMVFMTRNIFPDLIMQLLLVAAACGLLLSVVKGQRQPLAFAEHKHFLFALVLLIGGFWLSFVLYYNPLPRYTTFIVFPTAAALALLLSQRKTLSTFCALVFLVFGIANHNGALLPTVDRSGIFLERSREYLKDIDGNRKICKRLENNHFSDPVVAKYPFVQMLTLPELGYVHYPLPNVYAAGPLPQVTTARRYTSTSVMPANTVYVYAPNLFEKIFRPSLLPGDDAFFLMAERSHPSPILLYRKRAAFSGTQH